jgi:hypothetical protein
VLIVAGNPHDDRPDASAVQDDLHTRETTPFGVAPLVPPLRPSRAFADLAAALEVSASVTHIEMGAAMANIGATAENLTTPDLIRLGPEIRRVADYLCLVHEPLRATIHAQVERLIRDAESAPKE